MKKILLAVVVILLSVSSAQAFAQTRPPDADFVAVPKPEPSGVRVQIPATAFWMPDVPDEWNKKSAFDSRAVSARLGVAMLVDYNAFTQNAASVLQVGDQTNQWDLRTWRITSRGQIKLAHPIDYFVSLEIKGQDHVPTGDSTIGFTDWYFGTSLGRIGNIRYGKIKEPFVYEMVGDAANLPQQERILSPFFVSRGTGFRLDNTMAHERMSWSVGWYNAWWVELL